MSKICKKGYIEMGKWIYLGPLKSVLGRSILHYSRAQFSLPIGKWGKYFVMFAVEIVHQCMLIKKALYRFLSMTIFLVFFFIIFIIGLTTWQLDTWESLLFLVINDCQQFRKWKSPSFFVLVSFHNGYNFSDYNKVLIFIISNH